MIQASLDILYDFLPCATPQAWIDEAVKPENLALLLIDHAHCEKKAASTAMTLMFRYVEKPALLHKMSRLAREELIHFEQVMKILHARGFVYEHLTPALYAEGLRKLARNHEPAKLIDVLIIGALIEARSCERFAKLAPYLDTELKNFYEGLLKSESRHFNDYLKLANDYSDEPIDERINVFRNKEKELILGTDTEFRFHSGIPV